MNQFSDSTARSLHPSSDASPVHADARGHGSDGAFRAGLPPRAQPLRSAEHRPGRLGGPRGGQSQDGRRAEAEHRRPLRRGRGPPGRGRQAASRRRRRTTTSARCSTSCTRQIDAVIVEHARPHARRGRRWPHSSWASTSTARSRSRIRSTRPGCWPRRRPRHKVATQMGNEGHSERGDPPRRRADPAPARSARSARSTPGPTGRSGRRASTGPATAAGPVVARTGTSGSARRPSGPTTRPITRSSGEAGGTSAPAPWATWAATSSTPRSGPSTCAIRRPSRPRARR